VAAEDGACADVRVLADEAVTEVREMVRLGPAVEARLLRLDEVADVRLLADVTRGAEMREGPDLRAGANDGVRDHAVRLERDTLGDVRVRQNAAHVDRRAFPDPRVPPEDCEALDGRVFLDDDG